MGVGEGEKMLSDGVVAEKKGEEGDWGDRRSNGGQEQQDGSMGKSAKVERQRGVGE